MKSFIRMIVFFVIWVAFGVIFGPALKDVHVGYVMALGFLVCLLGIGLGRLITNGEDL